MSRERRLKVQDDHLKKEIITGKNVDKGGGIAVSWRSSDTVQQFAGPIYTDEVELPSLSLEDLENRIESSSLSQPQKEQILVSLQDLEGQFQDDQDVNLKTTRGLLEDIGATMPELREPLWHWLTETVHVSGPVEIVARKLLHV